MSPTHFQRTFKTLVGVTPKEYADKLRFDDLKVGLKKMRTIAECIYENGFGSSSRVYEKSNLLLGMTPAQYGSGGRGVEISYVAIASPLGRMLLGATDKGICFLQFGERDEDLLRRLESEFPLARVDRMRERDGARFQEWTKGIALSVLHGEECLAIPVDVRATAFQLKVWNWLHTVAYGEARAHGGWRTEAHGSDGI